MVMQTAFTALLAAVAAQRLFELRRSRANEAVLRKKGAREHAAWQMPIMAALHTLWLVGAAVEVWWLDRPVLPWLSGVALVIFAAGQLLRLAAMRALGERWTVRVLTLPGAPPVVDGIYRYLRHPNYAGVVLEMAALPLVGGALRTAILGSAANALLLSARIRAEERALAADNDYFAHFGRATPSAEATTRSERRP